MTKPSNPNVTIQIIPASEGNPFSGVGSDPILELDGGNPFTPDEDYAIDIDGGSPSDPHHIADTIDGGTPNGF